MTEITHGQVRDLLPDVLHARIGDRERALVESHLHSCAECASEMRVLQMVKNSSSFAPMIDAVKVSSAILPYGGVPTERPATRPRAWQLALAVAAVALIAVTLIPRGNQPNVPAVNTPATVAVAPGATTLPVSSARAPESVKATAVTPAKVASAGKELQVAAGLAVLSDGSIAQLVRELEGLDGLPSAEPENLGVSDPNIGGEGGA